MRDEHHLSLVLRTLQIEEELWSTVARDFAVVCRDANRNLSARLRAFKRIWAAYSPHEAAVKKAGSFERACSVCPAGTMRVAAARKRNGASPLIYGVCSFCGLGILLEGTAASGIYSQPEYYERRDGGGAGYPNYAEERAYREAKGYKLVSWITEQSMRPLETFLEVGSGFGFTRAAAEQLGFESAGIDRNPHAATAAREMYAQRTFTGTLEEALESNSLNQNAYDVVCYQFLLEHLADPAGELALAAQVLSDRGVLVLVVPNMQSYEREIFSGAYRSFRHDHLWLFSPASLRILLNKAGLKVVAMESECNVKLLRSFLSDEDFDFLDKNCLSADMRVVAERK